MSPIMLHMSSPVHTARPDTDVVEAARVMSQRRISRLPVVDDQGRPLGIATFSNISRVMQQLASDIFSGWDRTPVSVTITRDL
jgi:Mg/Co/Ni transporter MgtE